MIPLIKQGRGLVRNNDLSTLVAAISRKDAHLLVQFAKYSLCGTLATSVQVGVFYLLAWTVFPAALAT